uniref:Putative secreted peptide n=1 Tax=Anopheles braziliensis TaxID=58242 RepID=A0A2M3ZPJ3_9DIPT
MVAAAAAAAAPHYSAADLVHTHSRTLSRPPSRSVWTKQRLVGCLVVKCELASNSLSLSLCRFSSISLSF